MTRNDFSKLLFAPVIAACLWGCAKTDEASSEVAADQPAAAAEPVKVREVPASSQDSTGMLRITPGAIDRCEYPEGRVEMTVAWDAGKAGAKSVKVMFQGPNVPFEEAKLWARKGAKDEQTTGRWTTAGSTFTLLNAETDEKLASVVVEDLACD